MSYAEMRGWIARNQREILLASLLWLAGFQFGRVAGRIEQRRAR